GHVLSTPVGRLVAGVSPAQVPVPAHDTRLSLLDLIRPVRLVVVVLVLTVRVVLVLVTVVVLYEAEVDRHLPHGTGHPAVLPACTHLRRPIRPTRGTLPDTRPAIAEQRRTDSEVCRAGLDGGLEIAAHPGRNHRGAWPDPAHGGRAGQQPRERVGGLHGQRGDRHHAAE